MTNVTNIFDDKIEAMKGPVASGHDVIIEGHLIPNLTMRDCGDQIEFILDRRLSWSFPRDLAHYAADFAATAMAIGAGHPHYKHPKGDKPFGRPCMELTFPGGEAAE
jgi:hypothetical protein